MSLRRQCLFSFFSTVKVQAIFGETDKWNSLSSDRIDFISLGTEGSVDVIFSQVDVAEKINVSYILEDKLYSHECALYPGIQPTCRLYGP